MPAALITGAAGQDGWYLAELLLAKGYTVHGVVRPTGNPRPVAPGVERHLVDIVDAPAIEELVQRLRPAEVYNLAAQSHVVPSISAPLTTMQTNAVGAMAVLEAARRVGAKFAQASSSEMFGNCPTIRMGLRLAETDEFLPASPYGIAKLAAHHAVRVARESHGAFACCAIMFNHESPRRGQHFVSQVISRQVAALAQGQEARIVLGNAAARRDWSHARDMMRGLWQMLQHPTPDDYVFASGTDRSVTDWVRAACAQAGLPPDLPIHQEGALLRPNDIHALRGDATKARTILGWSPEIPWESLVQEMLEAQLSA